ncbi:MAG: bifunctional folylpolyglutamate synthase/dihydrofolate synthase, partial [Alphaproteobacteria bacterium]
MDAVPVPNPPRPSEAILDRLARLHPRIIDLSLTRIETLLARLDDPHRRLAPVVHVAGTNGKGSVIAFLRAMLEAAGARVQTYTSPHLVRFHERIRLADGPICDAALSTVLSTCEAANGTDPITFFEITTAAAFLAFARDRADILLLETGLGGRLDATNVIERPRLCVITPVSIDHVQYLGETIEEIAFEKAGILKPGVPAVIGPQPPAALAVIERRAKDIGAPLFRHGHEWHATGTTAGGIRFRGATGVSDHPAPGLPGAFQIDNAGIALACAELLSEYRLDDAARATGLRQATWPARLHRLTRGPLPEKLPAGWELWLDGGHNAAAGAALAAIARNWADRPLDLVYGMLNTKAARDFIRPLAAQARTLHAVSIPGVEATLSAEAAANEAAAAGLPAVPCAGVADALDAIVAANPAPPGRVLICGSLYLAG